VLHTKNYLINGIGGRLFNKFFNRKKDPIMLDVINGYAHWAKNYPAEAHNPLMEIEQQAMLSLLPDNLRGKVCLDLACGSGRYMHILQERRVKQVVGLDYSPEMLAQANNPKSEIKNPKLVRASFLALPYANEMFDFITCGLAVGHEKNLCQILSEVARVLRPGGMLLYSDFHPLGTLLGWQRTFIADNGTVYSLEHYLHLYSHHHQGCQAAGLVIDKVVEPFGGPKVPTQAQSIPVVLVIRAVKTGSNY